MLENITIYDIIMYKYAVIEVKMSVKDFIETTSVFTIEEFKTAFPTVTGYNLLMRAAKAGKVLRVTRGVYASSTGRYKGVKQDRFRIASKLASNVIFAYHSALELHGVAHSTSSRVQYYSAIKRKAIEFQGNYFKQYQPDDESLMIQTIRATAYGSVSVTTKEQTLLDCLSNIGRGGGVEEVLRSISGFPYIDVSEVKERAVFLSSSTIARIGWVLEQKREKWNVAEKDMQDLQSILVGGAYRFVSEVQQKAGWANRWRLILPNTEDDMKEWVL